MPRDHTVDGNTLNRRRPDAARTPDAPRRAALGESGKVGPGYRGSGALVLAGRVDTPAGRIWLTSPVEPVPLPCEVGSPCGGATAGRLPS